jgi:hypothetical protein
MRQRSQSSGEGTIRQTAINDLAKAGQIVAGRKMISLITGEAHTFWVAAKNQNGRPKKTAEQLILSRIAALRARKGKRRW